ncbi:MAG: dienelactone hydrolase family protein [Acidimicrobiales bacterium]|nr:dienelactone hydrolase family protein [Acidimicrobiales bacterium]
MVFSDRVDAGRRLGAALGHLRGSGAVVVGLPRGGVPVADEVAVAIDAPLDVIVVRKLGVPYQPELAMGAVGEDGIRVLNREVLALSGVNDDALEAIEARERAEVDRRATRFRAGRPRVTLAGRTVIVVDDGIATGSTARAACQVARAEGATRVVLAAPVAPPDTAERLAGDCDELVILDTPEPFFAIGQFYVDFGQVPDEEVVRVLDAAAARWALATGADPPAVDRDVTVQAGTVRLPGHLSVPQAAAGVVVFAHGSGSSRHSPRNRYVAAVLQEAGLGTLLFDLLTAEEERDRANVFDIDLLGRRLAEVRAWLRTQPETAGLPVGFFGASTGAAAALWAATEPGADVTAVVSRGGRPDLAGPRLGAVRAPTLLVVGGHDVVVLDLNHEAAARLRCEHEVAVVPGATHLFEEPGTLEAAAGLARDWFRSHFAAAPAGTGARP